MAIVIMALTLITFTALGYLALEVQSLRASAKRQGELLQEATAERDKLDERIRKGQERTTELKKEVKENQAKLHATLGEIIIRLKTAETAVGIKDGRERAQKRLTKGKKPETES
ncbi:hypothetical protein [Porphyromonas sp. oral taxon 278]|uniref:hypothetical protein n=1 Tax=Porphyromonas sp. oral taxon 278 TaxID=712437 RepID=UPI0025CD27A7|nr:hypothetical protein [Porphyromonas sp. oral taxon 278]